MVWILRESLNYRVELGDYPVFVRSEARRLENSTSRIYKSVSIGWTKLKLNAVLSIVLLGLSICAFEVASVDATCNLSLDIRNASGISDCAPDLSTSRVRKKAEIFLSARSSLEVEALR